jgi:hypothetical protein
MSSSRTGFSAFAAAALLALALILVRLEPPWLSLLIERVGEAVHGDGKHYPGSLQEIGQQLARLPVAEQQKALGATISPEGHWTFINREGEQLTAATPDEIKRAPALLLPGGPQGGTLTLHLTQDAVFRQGQDLSKLAIPADLRLALGPASYRLVPRPGTAGRYLAEVRPNLLLELTDREAVAEVLWQLRRPVRALRVRVLALELGGPPDLSPAPRKGAGAEPALIDTVDPYRLPAAMKSIAGQTAVVVGRVEGQLLYFRPASGPEQSVMLADLVAAATASDVNLLVLHAATPRQPGGRNWLWQRVQVSGLEGALARATLADFLDALAADRGRLMVSLSRDGGRVTLGLRPAEGERARPEPGGIGDLVAGTIAGVTGRVVPWAADAYFVSSDRARELEARIVPGIHSGVQFGYLALLAAGLIGLRFAGRWWHRVWPPEQRAEYASRLGYRAAVGVRFVGFLLIFLPLVGLAAAPWTMGSLLRRLAAIAAAPGRRLEDRRSAQST